MFVEHEAEPDESVRRTSGELSDTVAAARDALETMQIEEARQMFERAEAEGHDPDVCAAGRWTCYMLQGEFEQAWRESDAIEARGRPDPHRFWDGKPFKGKRVMLRCLHGLGDTIQFIRFAPLIRAEARHLVVEAQPGLKTLLAASGVADDVITWGEPEPKWDQQIEVNELPRIFRTTEDTIPRSVPYLFVPDRQMPELAKGKKFRVGLVWASSIYNPLRSVPLELLGRALDLPELSLFSLQAGATCEELRSWPNEIENLCEHSQTVLETAEHMSQMDLVITVDTMAAHLAGALAMPTWVLLPFACDWRWMTDREDSPWYPTLRLFRQTLRGDWDSALDRVRKCLLCYQEDSRQRARRSEFTHST